MPNFFSFLLICQASKDKISFGRFEVHELAVFVRNSSGKYEAVNRNHSNYYLSDESVALFTEQHSTQPAHIIGQIVHIERCVVQSDMSGSRSGSGSRFGLNPYNLPVGSEYSVVTIALLPDTIRSSASWSCHVSSFVWLLKWRERILNCKYSDINYII